MPRRATPGNRSRPDAPARQARASAAQTRRATRTTSSAPPDTRLNVLMACSEVHPFSKTGGLADMTGALARALADAATRVTLVTPLYRGIRERFPNLRRLDYQIDLPLGTRRVQAQIFHLGWATNLEVYFIDQPGFYDRPEIYQEQGEGYADNAARFVFLSKCVAHLARYLPLHPDIVHVHDWQVALVPLLLLHQRWREGWGSAPRSCLTIHNLAYQGGFAPWDYDLTNLPWEYWMPGVECYGSMNCLKAGIHFADVLTAVSPRYAREILTESSGWGLDGELRRRQDDLVGILNGVDYQEWRTERNPYLPHAYSARSFAGKDALKAKLQREFGLPEEANTPLFGNISRLVDQKGSDLILGAFEEMLASRMQFVLLGSGTPSLERAYEALARRFPRQVAVRIGYDQALAHRIEAGSDFFLMPSRFEPCGLNQMYSLRYGTVPIVRATGGLDDSVIDAHEDPVGANGIKFRDPSARALANAIRKALALYASPEALRLFRKNGMRADFSWERTAQAYLKVYRWALNPEHAVPALEGFSRRVRP